MAIGTPAYSAVVDGRHAGVSAYLINANPLAARLPFRWKSLHVQSAGIEAAGLAIPGVPGLWAGRNTDVAWGVLPAEGFRMQWMRLDVDPENYQYRDESGQWQPMTLMRDTIRVGQRDQEYVIYETAHGRIVNLHASQILDSAALVIDWQDAASGDELGALMGLMRSADRADFLRAVKQFRTPSLRFLYADRRGQIGIVEPGPRPIIDERHLLVRDHADVQPANGFFPDSQGVILPSLEPGQHLAQSIYGRRTIDRLVGSGIPEYAAAVRVLPALVNWLKIVDLEKYKGVYQDIEDVVFVLSEWDNNPGDDYLATCILSVWQAMLARNVLGERMNPELFVKLITYPQLYQTIIARLFSAGEQGASLRAAWEIDSDEFIAGSFVSALQILKKYVGEDLYRWELQRLFDSARFRQDEPFIDHVILHYIMRGPEAAGSRSNDFFPVSFGHPVYQAGRARLWAVDWDNDDRYGFGVADPFPSGILAEEPVADAGEPGATREACFCLSDAGKSLLIYRLQPGPKK